MLPVSPVLFEVLLLLVLPPTPGGALVAGRVELLLARGCKLLHTVTELRAQERNAQPLVEASLHCMQVWDWHLQVRTDCAVRVQPQAQERPSPAVRLHV